MGDPMQMQVPQIGHKVQELRGGMQGYVTDTGDNAVCVVTWQDGRQVRYAKAAQGKLFALLRVGLDVAKAEAAAGHAGAKPKKKAKGKAAKKQAKKPAGKAAKKKPAKKTGKAAKKKKRKTKR